MREVGLKKKNSIFYIELNEMFLVSEHLRHNDLPTEWEKMSNSWSSNPTHYKPILLQQRRVRGYKVTFRHPFWMSHIQNAKISHLVDFVKPVHTNLSQLYSPEWSGTKYCIKFYRTDSDDRSWGWWTLTKPKFFMDGHLNGQWISVSLS